MKYERRVQRVCAMARFGSVCVKKSSVLVSGGGEDVGGLWTTKILLLFEYVLKGAVKVKIMRLYSIWT